MLLDREDGGRRLAARLARYRFEPAVVLALPRGGVAVGVEVAQGLGAPLDVLVVRKIGAPWQPEFGIGAVAEGGVVVLDQPTIRLLKIPPEELDRLVERERREAESRVARYRRGRPFPDVTGKTVILVDDGIATGFTARAAVRLLRQRGAGRVVLAAPVAAAQTAQALRAEVDELVCVLEPSDLVAIGEWYADFRQLTDEEVLSLLERRERELEAGRPVHPG